MPEPGDGIVFDAADWRSPQEEEEGGRIFQIEPGPRDRLTLRFGNGAIDPARIRPGDLVWRSHSPATDKAARPYLEAKTPLARQDVAVKVTAHVGKPLRTEWCLSSHRVEVCSESPLESSRNQGLSQETLREQLGRLGGTPYRLRDLASDIQGSPFVPVSVLNQLRRDAVERLADLQSRPARVEIRDARASAEELRPQKPVHVEQSVMIHILVRESDQLDGALSVKPASVTLDYLDLYGLHPSINKVVSRGVEARVASPRILKPGEERIVDFLLRSGGSLLVRPAGLLYALHDRPHPRLTGDFSLNAANAISAADLLDRGLERITPTHDLNAAQIVDLAEAIGPERLEVIAYQHLPVFHTEHCVFCRFLSSGTSYKDCGRPCEKHRVALRDKNGRAHPVVADVGCRNTVFGAEAQEASLHMGHWLDVGIRHFRLEFVHESADEVARIAEAFQEYFAHRDSMRLEATLRKIAPQGVTEGSLFVPPPANLLPVLQ